MRILSEIPLPGIGGASASISPYPVRRIGWEAALVRHVEGSPIMAKPQTFTVSVNATPEQIWPYIGDLNRHDEWSPKPFAIEWVSGEPNAVGSTYRSKGYLPQDKDHSMEGTVITSDAPKRFAVRSYDKDGEFVNTLELTPQGAGTTVTRTVEFPEPKGAFVVLLPILLPIVIRPGIQKGMNLLKTKVEGS